MEKNRFHTETKYIKGSNCHIIIISIMIELGYDDPIAEQPQGAKIALKRHQLTLLRKMLDTEHNGVLSPEKNI
jgi:hypothetical protein